MSVDRSTDEMARTTAHRWPGPSFDLTHGRDREFRTFLDARRPARGDGLGLGVEADRIRAVLIEITEGVIGLDFAMIADAKLTMTDELIAESLKGRKAAGVDPAKFDEIEEDKPDPREDTP